jgi:hypothetical protein
MVLRSARPGVIAHATGVELPALGPLFFYDGAWAIRQRLIENTALPCGQSVPVFGINTYRGQQL